MFNIGLSEIVFLLVIALIFIGPKQLPEVARTIARFLNELKRASNEVRSQMLSPDYIKTELKDKIVEKLNERVEKNIGETSPTTTSQPQESYAQKVKEQALGQVDSEKTDKGSS